MELNFYEEQLIGQDMQYPNIVHRPDNSLWLFTVSNQFLYSSSMESGMNEVDWQHLQFERNSICASDKHVDLVRMKNIPRIGIFGVWHQEDVYRETQLFSPERHRLALWGATTDLSAYVKSCQLEFSDQSLVSGFQIELYNPEKNSDPETLELATPGMKVEVFLALGDSEDYPMGVYYVDRIRTGVPNTNVIIEGRNISGKQLKDQTFNTLNVFTTKVFRENIVQLLEQAGIHFYRVQPAPTDPEPWQYGIEFKPDQTLLKGLETMIQAARNWKVIETLDGELIAGSIVSFPDIQVNSRYVFQRNEDIFSRQVVYDDNEVYAKICCYFEVEVFDEQENETIKRHEYIYEPIINESQWDIQAEKALYVQVPKNSNIEEIRLLAHELAERLKWAGTQETFVGPIRPYLLPGDEACIVSNSQSKMLGIIETVRHRMGIDGFATEFSVDSSGQKGKPKMKDYIQQLSKGVKDEGTRL